MQARLARVRDAESAVRWVRLVAVLGQPDALRAEVARHLTQQPLERRHRDRLAVRAPAGERRRRAVERIRMVRVGVEPGTRGAHAADEVDRGKTPGRAPRRGDPSGHPGAAARAVDRGVGRVQQPADVGRGGRRPQPAALVRLVPDHPLLHPRVALGGCRGERRERRPRGRRPVRRPAEIRPAWRAPDRDDRADACSAQALQDGVGAAPVALGASRLDHVPVERVADEVDTEGIELRDALVERAVAVLKPRIVLDAVLDTWRRAGGSRGRSDDKERANEDYFPHAGTVPSLP